MLPEKEREMSLCFNLTQTVTLLMVNCVIIGLELERRGKSLFTRCWACSCFCMDHPVTIVFKQRVQRRGGELEDL